MMWRSMIAFHLFVLGNSLLVIEAKKNQTFKERVDLFAKLADCDYYESNVKNYTDFFRLVAFENPQTPDTLLRFPVYVIGARNAHFCLAAVDKPNWEKDFAYEIVIGGSGNKRSSLRKKIGAYPLNDVNVDGLLNIRKPAKFLIEITKAGYINVYNGSESKPFISAFDPKPIPVKYISFAGHDTDTGVEFLYNCSSTSEILATTTEPPTVSTENSASSLTDADISVLAAKCQVVESWEHIYDDFIPLSSIQKKTRKNNTFRMELFVVASRDAHIMLSSNDKVNVTTDDVYEIVIGGWKNTHHFIRRHVDGDALTELELLDILSPTKQVKVIIQMAEDGLIEVFFGDKQYKPTFGTVDENPLQVKFISFASSESSRAIFFYNCIESEESQSEEPEQIHTLLATHLADDADALAKQCQLYEAYENEYRTAHEIANFENARANNDDGDYYFRLPLYVQGERDASILISVNQNDNTKDVYEITIGGWGNTRTVINKNGIRLAEAIEYNILNEKKPVKIIVEMSTDSNLKIFTDHNKFKPLLNVSDPNPITNVRYISFAGYYRALRFFFDCKDTK